MEANPCQRRAGLMLSQLSYIPTLGPCQSSAFLQQGEDIKIILKRFCFKMPCRFHPKLLLQSDLHQWQSAGLAAENIIQCHGWPDGYMPSLWSFSSGHVHVQPKWARTLDIVCSQSCCPLQKKIISETEQEVEMAFNNKILQLKFF